MSELTTKTGTDVANEVKRLFGDPDGVQITDDDILRWTNSAQRRIVATNPILQKRVKRDIVAGQADYQFDADRVQYIQSLLYDDIPLDGLSYTEAQEYILKNLGEATAKPLLWYQWAQTITLWPTPKDALVNGLTLDYVAIPVELTALTEDLSVPDRYFEAVVEQVMMNAHLLDEDFDAASFARSRFSESLSTLSEQENRMPLRSYPTVTVLPEDL